MAFASPPITPIRPKGFGRKPVNYYTLHSGGNNAFTLRLNDEYRTSVVGFKNKSDAIFFAKMIETQYIRDKEWPDKNIAFLRLQLPTNDELAILHIHKWELEDLKVVCTRNILDMMSVTGIVKTQEGYSIEGETYQFEAPLEFYQSRFEEFLGT